MRIMGSGGTAESTGKSHKFATTRSSIVYLQQPVRLSREYPSFFQALADPNLGLYLTRTEFCSGFPKFIALAG